MNSDGTRMTRLEERGPCLDRRFVGWNDNPWTPEQMAAAMRQHPQQRVFWRSRLETTRVVVGGAPALLGEVEGSPPQSPVPLGDLSSVPPVPSVVPSVARSLSPPGAFTRKQLQAMESGHGLFARPAGIFRRRSRCLDG